MTDHGVILGAGTILLAADGHGGNLSDPDFRFLALLSVAYKRRVAPDVIAIVRNAPAQWARGEKCLAHIHLAFARLPRLESREDAFQLFWADQLLVAGVAPSAILKTIDFDAGRLDLRKFNSDQPRVPAGHGRESGRWGSGGIQPIFYDGKPHEQQKTESLEFEERERFGGNSPQEEIEHGRPIQIAPQIVVPFAVAPPWSEGNSSQRPPGNPPSPDDDDKQPKLCPDPGLDHGGGRKEFDLRYQQYVGSVVNPQIVPPLSPYLGYSLPNPDGGKPVVFDHCQYSDGAMIDAKGHYEDFIDGGFMQDIITDDWLNQAARQVAAARAAGNRRVEWWFYEQSAADLAAKEFSKDPNLKDIIIRQLDYPGDARWPYPPSATWAKGRQKQ
jgi:hypothetical protein